MSFHFPPTGPVSLRRRSMLASLAGLCAASVPAAMAQPQSSRPIRIIVVGTAGATADLLARTMADALSKSLKQPVIVEPKPGAGGAVAMDAFLKSPADGHTYLLAVSSLVTEVPYLFKPKYDPFSAIKPLVELGGTGAVLVGNINLPPKNLEEMIAYVRANKGKINIASYSPGTMSHLLGLQLNTLAGLDMNVVQYNGSTPGLVDVIGGNVQFMMDSPFTSIPMLKTGKIKAYAISSPQRNESLPDVPTFAELGYGGMTRISWMGLWTLPNTPEAMQHQVREEALKALAQPEITERLTSLGLSVNTRKPRTPEELSKSLAADYQSTGELLRAVNFKS